jgi:magnesium chelatase subunit I
MADFDAIVPAITGKVELVYEGEQLGSEAVAYQLIGAAIKTLFNEIYRPIKKLKKPTAPDEFDAVVHWFVENSSFELGNDVNDTAYAAMLNKIKPMQEVLDAYVGEVVGAEKVFLQELLLWGLVEYKQLSKQKMGQGISFNDDILGPIYGAS